MEIVYLKELIVYIVYFLEEFFMVYLFVKDCRRRTGNAKRLLAVFCLGIAFQFLIAALRLIENSPVLSALKFALSLTPLVLFLWCYQLNVKTLFFNMLFASAVRQWTNVALAIFLIFFPDATFYVQRLLNLASFFVLFIPVYFIFTTTRESLVN